MSDYQGIDQLQPINKSRFKSAEHEVYLMRVATAQWKQWRKTNAMGYGGDHPEFMVKCQELGLDPADYL